MPAALLSFPLVYFFFGLLVSPFVADIYSEGAHGLSLPGPGMIVTVQLLRSSLFLIFTIPIFILWKGSRRRLILSLTAAHFVMVYAYDIILAYQLPAELLIIHGIEILLDSLAYSLILVKLVYSANIHCFNNE